MRQNSRANAVAFRRAVWASVGFHVVAACALVLFVQSDECPPAEVALDTRATNEPQVRMSFPEVDVSLEPPLAKPQAAEPVAPQAIPEVPSVVEPTMPQAPTPEVPPALPSSPLAASRAAPQVLPPELLALLRKPATATAPPAPNPPFDPNVKPAGGASETTAPAIHGALNPNQTVVYVLDCSGSMGAAGKFDAARAALVSTLKQQPATVRFQVITYAGGATPLLASNGTALPANDANVRTATDKLAKLEARGTSNHPEAVQAALAFRPDVILLLTDADDLDAKALKSIAASGPKVVLVCVGQVTAEGVQSPRELK
jgi:hypothetical protein